MNIGMVVYSRTGNTHSVALKLQEKLSAAGHAVTMERLKAVGEARPGAKDIRFEELPDLGAYDALVFGSPVQGFGLAPAMVTYMKQLGSLQGKKVGLLVTEVAPFGWMGGNRAIGQMKKACESRGATVCGSGLVNWMRPGRERQIAQVVGSLSKLF